MLFFYFFKALFFPAPVLARLFRMIGILHHQLVCFIFKISLILVKKQFVSLNLIFCLRNLFLKIPCLKLCQKISFMYHISNADINPVYDPATDGKTDLLILDLPIGTLNFLPQSHITVIYRNCFKQSLFFLRLQ